jgi:hypothetical protein
MPIADHGGTEMLILRWVIAFLCNDCVSTVMLIILLAAASVALIPLNDWLVLSRAARQESGVDYLEALWALEDCRRISRPRMNQFGRPRR